MEIKARFSTTFDIVARGKARDRHSFHRSLSFRFHNDIVAIPVWQRDIAQHNVELFRVDHIQRASGIVSGGNVMAKVIKKPRQRLQRVAMILYDQNAGVVSASKSLWP